MICEKCGEDIQNVTCVACGEAILHLGPHCYKCGAGIEARVAAGSAEEHDDLDFSSRILCSDGNCIGVVNKEGICKVCGKPYTPEM